MNKFLMVFALVASLFSANVTADTDVRLIYDNGNVVVAVDRYRNNGYYDNYHRNQYNGYYNGLYNNQYIPPQYYNYGQRYYRPYGYYNYPRYNRYNNYYRFDNRRNHRHDRRHRDRWDR